jgi:predicted nucleic acid-binding protein
VIRFWDTSALVKIYSPTEPAHRTAVGLLHGRRARAVRHATSMIAAVELVSAIVRRTGDRELAAAAIGQLDAFSQVEFIARHRDVAIRLASSGIARGADTAIAAQVLEVAAISRTRTQGRSTRRSGGSGCRAHGRTSRGAGHSWRG